MLSDLQREALLAELGGLRKFCISLTGTVADGDDLLQATVERVLEKGMPEDAHVAKWAYRVCKNAWIDEIRARDGRRGRQRGPWQSKRLRLHRRRKLGASAHFGQRRRRGHPR